MSLARLTALLATILLVGCGSHAVKQVSPPTTTAQTKIPQAKRAVFTIPAGSGHLAAMAPVRGLTLRDRPGGKVVAHLRATTEWGSPTVVWSVARRGPWVAVMAAALENNRVGWIDVRKDRPRLWRSPLTLHADLSERTLEL